MNAGPAVAVVGAFAVPAALIASGLPLALGRFPKHPNETFGYRTARSMRNGETWAFAQKLRGRPAVRFGLAAFALSSAAVIFLRTTPAERFISRLVGLMLLESLLPPCTIPPVERTLKKAFDEHGRRKMN